MSNTITLSTGSGIFHLYPPDTYSMEEEFSYKEDQENESYQSLRAEKNDEGVRWKDLPKEHTDHLEEGYFDLRAQKYLKKILAPAWVDAFNETIKNRDNSIKIIAKMTGTYSPDFYNFETDQVKFDLIIPKKDLIRIKKEVFEYEDVFDEYLREYNSSDSVPRSCMPGSVQEWRSFYYGGMTSEGVINSDSRDCKRAMIALLEFWLFAFEWFPEYQPRKPSLEAFAEGVKEFREEFDRQIESFTCNGAESDCYDFFPEGSKDYNWVVKHYFLGRKPCEVFVA